MSPKNAAEFLRENFSVEEQIAEIQLMLKEGGHVTALAHGIAVELKIAEHDDLKNEMVESLKLSAEALAVGYGGLVGRDVGEGSPFAGKGPMYAAMGAIDEDDQE